MFGLTRPGIEPESTVLVADALFKFNRKFKFKFIDFEKSEFKFNLYYDLILSFSDQFINLYFHSVSFDLRKSNSSNV